MTHPSRRLAAIAAAVALAAALSGCGGDPDPKTSATPEASTTASPTTPSTSPSPSESPAPSSAPSPTPGTPIIKYDENGNPQYCGEDQAKATGPAAKKFGADNVMAAYCQMVQFSMDYAFSPGLVRPAENRKAIEFSEVEPFMTQTMRSTWKASVVEALGPNGENSEGENAVLHLMVYNLTNPDMVFPEDPNVPVVYNHSFTDAITAVDTTQPTVRLALTFTLNVDLAMVDKKSGADYFLPISKTTTYYLAPNANADIPWLIDGVDNDYLIGERRKAKGL